MTTFEGGPAHGQSAARVHPDAAAACWRAEAGPWQQYVRPFEGSSVLIWAGPCPPVNDHHHDQPDCPGHRPETRSMRDAGARALHELFDTASVWDDLTEGQRAVYYTQADAVLTAALGVCKVSDRWKAVITDKARPAESFWGHSKADLADWLRLWQQGRPVVYERRLHIVTPTEPADTGEVVT